MARKPEYAHYPKLTYSVIQDGLIRVLVEKQVGRNGLAVLLCLCKTVFADGKLAPMSSDAIQRLSGLSRTQVMHGMNELRTKEILVPVARRMASGAYKPDRSMPGHICQYRFTKPVWGRIEKIDPAEE